MSRGRGPRLAVGAGTAALVLLGIGAAANGTLSYSTDPAQLTSRYSACDRVRLAGTVVPGTLFVDRGSTTFVLSGGGGRTEVHAADSPSGTFREGGQAVVEGRLAADGTVVADVVMARHANTYRAEDGDRGQP